MPPDFEKGLLSLMDVILRYLIMLCALDQRQNRRPTQYAPVHTLCPCFRFNTPEAPRCPCTTHLAPVSETVPLFHGQCPCTMHCDAD